MAQVEMICGPYRLVSLMSAEAADELGLEPGVLADRVRQVHQRRRGAAHDPHPRRSRRARAGALLLPLAGCGSDDDTDGGRRRGSATLTVLAAASLTETFTTLADEFEADHAGVDRGARLRLAARPWPSRSPRGPRRRARHRRRGDHADRRRRRRRRRGDPRSSPPTARGRWSPRPTTPPGSTSFADLDDGVTYVVCVDTAPCGKLAAAAARRRRHHDRAGQPRGRRQGGARQGELDEADAGLVYAHRRGRGRRRGHGDRRSRGRRRAAEHATRSPTARAVRERRAGRGAGSSWCRPTRASRCSRTPASGRLRDAPAGPWAAPPAAAGAGAGRGVLPRRPTAGPGARAPPGGALLGCWAPGGPRRALAVAGVTSRRGRRLPGAGIPLAWVLARVDFPGRSLVRALVTVPLVLPPVVAGVALLSAFGRTGSSAGRCTT